MSPINFDRLVAAYPTDYHPCRLSNGDSSFDNQCAIRFGIALQGGGIKMSDFPGVFCWHRHGDSHALRAEEIAAWMKTKKQIFGTVDIRSDVDHSHYHGRRGLMLCRNFWGTGLQGDHIDLWNRNHMVSGLNDYISRSKEVWFWEVDANTAGRARKESSVSSPRSTRTKKQNREK